MAQDQIIRTLKIEENYGNRILVNLKIILDTVKWRAVDRSTIQFWTLWAKGHST